MAALATAAGVFLVNQPAGAAAATDVSLVQRDLNGLAYNAGTVDGDYGPATEGAVRKFQQENKLAIDGIVGPNTTAALLAKVKAVQKAAGATQDGDYGPATTTKVKSWQSAHGLTADGIAGPATMSAMGIARLAAGGTPNPPGCTAGSTSGTSAQKIERVVSAALSQTGLSLSYAWNGGGKCGPSWGVCCSPAGYDDTGRWGYDCSGFTQYSFWKGAGVDIGDWSGAQVGKGTRFPIAQVKRGDLIFYGASESSTDHVALYLGNGRMVEAASPRTTTSVHETAVRYGDALSFVVRIFT